MTNKIEFNSKWPVELHKYYGKFLGMFPKQMKFFSNSIQANYFLLIQLIFVATPNFCMTVKTILSITDIQEIIGTAYISLIMFMSFAKGIAFAKLYPKLLKIEACLDSEEFRIEKRVHQEIFNDNFVLWKLSFYIFLIIGLGITLLHALVPVFIPGSLPVPIWFPFNLEKTHFVYLWVYLTLSIMFMSYCNILNDTLSFCLMSYVSAFSEILANKIRYNYQYSVEFLKAKNINFNIASDEDQIHTQMRNNLIRYFKNYELIIEILSVIKYFLSIPVFLQFASSSISIGASLLKLTISEGGSGEFWNIMYYVLGIGFEIFMYCWYGNEIVLKSNMIPVALFESLWEDCPKAYKKELHMFLLRSQKPLVLYAVDLFPLRIEIFFTILRSAWSYYTLMSRIYAK